MAAPDNPHDFVGMMWRMSTMNERFLANHPRVDRSSLPFINVHGKPLTEAQVDTHLHKRLSQCASVGAAFLALHKTGTHCLRRGGLHVAARLTSAGSDVGAPRHGWFIQRWPSGLSNVLLPYEQITCGQPFIT